MRDFHGMHLAPSRASSHLVELDWPASPLGVPSCWPAGLKCAAELCLNARAAMLLLWGRDHIVICNDRALSVMGFDDAGAIGRTLGEACPALEAVVCPSVEEVRQRASSTQADDRLLLIERNGRPEEAYLKISCSPVFDEAGQVGGVLCILEDTTVEHLRKRRASTVGLLSQALSKLPSRDRIFPEIHRVLTTNRLDFACTAVFRVGPDNEITSWWSMPITYSGDVLASDAVADLVATLARGGVHRLVRPLGQRRFALCMVEESLLQDRSFVMIVEPDPRVSADEDYHLLLRLLLDTIVGAAYRVLLDRRTVAAMEVELSERDRLYRALFEHSHDCVLICGPNGTILAANPAACSFLGYSEDELRALGRGGIVPDDDGVLSRALAARYRDKRFAGELLFRRKDGSVVPVDVSSTLFEDDATGHGRAVVFFRDAAPRLASQRRIATAARLQAVGELTGGIAHDFNNLLNVIINGAEVLAERVAGDPAARQDADLVLSASLRAADLTRQLLAFSRQQPMKITSVDLGRVLREMDQILDRALGGGISVAMTVNDGLLVRADPTLLQSAMLNLCINARDAMPDGGRLWINGGVTELDGPLSEELSVPAGSYAVVTVQDEGVGIPPEDLTRVLEPFFTTKQPGKGTGLGLSSVFGFVRQSEGAMRMRSEPGRGTTVELYLPRASADVAQADPAWAEPGQAVQDRRRTPHVLVVEDDDLFSTMLAGILERAGYRVTVCSSGESALAVLDDPGDLDLLITDILLGPGVDGWAVTAHARNVRADLPVITMSGFAPPDDRRDPAARVTLAKPFRPREMLAAVERELRAA